MTDPTTKDSVIFRVLAAALEGPAAELRRIRWALHFNLDPSSIEWLDSRADELAAQAAACRAEAARLEQPAPAEPGP